MKRYISLFLLVVIVLSGLVVPTSAVKTADDDFAYELNEDGQSYTLTGAAYTVTGGIKKTLRAVVIPSTYNGLPVTAIGSRAFDFRNDITVIVIPEGVTEIGIGAFPNLTKLKAVTLPLSLKKIDSGAFGGSTAKLKYIYYPGSKEQLEEIDKSNNLDINKEGRIFSPAPDCHVIDDVVISTASQMGSGLTLEQCMVCGEVFEEIVTPQLPPHQPSIDAVYNGVDGVRIEYYAHEGHDYYYIYRKTAGTSWKRIRKADGRGDCNCYMECFCEEFAHRRIVDKDAKSGTTYYYTIKAENEVGFSTYDKTGVKVTYAEAPRLTKIANESKGIRISWKSVSDVDGYYVYRADITKTNNLNWTKIATIKKRSTQSYLDETVKSGRRYAYMVKSYDGKVLSAGEYLTSEYIATPKLTSVKNVKDGVQINWNKVSGTQEYIVYRKTSKTSWSRLGTTTECSFTDSTAKNGTTYYYTIKAQSKEYNLYEGKVRYYSAYDKTGLKIKYISAPELTKIANMSDGIRVYWSKVTGADGYYLYRRVTGTKDWTRLATVKSGSTVSYKDTKAAAGKTYDYIIRAYSANATSAPAEKVIRIKRLTVPSLTSVSNSNDGVTIKWKKVAGADSYIVYRKVYDAKTKQWSGWKRYNVVTKTSCVDRITESGVRYKYTVKACYGSYTSYYNTSGIEVIRLETPEISSATSTKAGVKLQWNKITGASGYKIYRKTGDNAWGEAIATVKGNSTITYVDKTAKKGVTYTYTVRAYNGNTKSGYIAAGKTVKDKY